MSNETLYAFFFTCITGLLVCAMLVIPSCQSVETCLKVSSSDAAKELLCERIIQQQYPIKTDYPNDEKTAR